MASRTLVFVFAFALAFSPGEGAESVVESSTVNASLADMLTPAQNVTDPTDALMVIRELWDHQLRTPNWQWLISLITVVFGLAMLISPKPYFKFVVAGGIFFITYTMAMGDLHEQHPDHDHGPHLTEPILAIEYATCAAVVAMRGFKGVELIISMSIAFPFLKFLNYYLALWSLIGPSPWWNLIMIASSSAFGFWLNYNHRLERLLTYVFPVLGGRLVSASIGWVLWEIGALLVQGAPPPPVWVDFWHSLPLDSNDHALAGMPNVGWSAIPEAMGFGVDWMGLVLGTLIWILLSAVFVRHHHFAVKERKERSKSEITASSKTPLLG